MGEGVKMLHYNGRGFLPGIPSRDLQDAEIDLLCKANGITRKDLTNSGCYSEVTQTTTIKTRTNKIARDNDTALDKEK